MNTRAARWAGCVLLAVATAAFAQAPAHSFDSGGVAIAYADQGRGEPVLLIHGFTGSYARHWEAPGVVQALERAGYRVVAMDCRGHGGSGKPHDPAQYGLEMVRDAVRLLDHLRIERAHIVGYSMGGAIASQLLVGHSTRVLTGTLLGSGWEGEDLKLMQSQMAAMADSLARRDASFLIRGVTSGAQKGPTDEEVAALNAALFARNDPDALAAAARGMTPLFEIPADRLRRVALPVLAIAGEHDANALKGIDRMAAVLRGLEVAKIPGATHASSVKPSVEPLLAFLAKHRSR